MYSLLTTKELDAQIAALEADKAARSVTIAIATGMAALIALAVALPFALI